MPTTMVAVMMMMMMWHDMSTHWDACEVDGVLLAVQHYKGLGGGHKLKGWDA
jgi:hypothetical protein